MTSDSFVTWIQQMFLPVTYHRHSALYKVILIVDNFSGHLGPDVINFAQIIMWSYWTFQPIQPASCSI